MTHLIKILFLPKQGSRWENRRLNPWQPSTLQSKRKDSKGCLYYALLEPGQTYCAVLWWVIGSFGFRIGIEKTFFLFEWGNRPMILLHDNTRRRVVNETQHPVIEPYKEVLPHTAYFPDWLPFDSIVLPYAILIASAQRFRQVDDRKFPQGFILSKKEKEHSFFYVKIHNLAKRHSKNKV